MKYHSKKTTVDGITFDSKHEAYRYCELDLLLKAGKIKDLELQKEFELIPAQYEFVENGVDRKGQPKRKKVCVERAVRYKADFCYYTEDGTYIVEDVKGFRTKDYAIKRKLMLLVHGIKIREVKV